MSTVIVIALWAYQFTGPFSEPGEVFGWLKGWANKTLPEWLAKPLIGCAKCHAFWVMLCVQIVSQKIEIWQLLAAPFMALLLVDFHELREKWKNN